MILSSLTQYQNWQVAKTLTQQFPEMLALTTATLHRPPSGTGCWGGHTGRRTTSALHRRRDWRLPIWQPAPAAPAASGPPLTRRSCGPAKTRAAERPRTQRASCADPPMAGRTNLAQSASRLASTCSLLRQSYQRGSITAYCVTSIWLASWGSC
jgi:hypothetical protein